MCASGTLAGILSPERPGSADGVGATGPRNPVKGHGVCNPNVEYGSPQHVPNTRAVTGGIQFMPNMGGDRNASKYPGAAGESSSDAWRSTHNYMAHGTLDAGCRDRRMDCKP